MLKINTHPFKGALNQLPDGFVPFVLQTFAAAHCK
jgi:hypothetical protein